MGYPDSARGKSLEIDTMLKVSIYSLLKAPKFDLGRWNSGLGLVGLGNAFVTWRESVQVN